MKANLKRASFVPALVFSPWWPSVLEPVSASWSR